MTKLKNILDKSLEVLVMVAVAVLVIDVLWQVFTRFIMGDPSSWTEELATFLLIWVALLGSAVALGRGAHLGIDYFDGKLEDHALPEELIARYAASLEGLPQPPALK